MAIWCVICYQKIPWEAISGKENGKGAGAFIRQTLSLNNTPCRVNTCKFTDINTLGQLFISRLILMALVLEPRLVNQFKKQMQYKLFTHLRNLLFNETASFAKNSKKS